MSPEGADRRRRAIAHARHQAVVPNGAEARRAEGRRDVGPAIAPVNRAEARRADEDRRRNEGRAARAVVGGDRREAGRANQHWRRRERGAIGLVETALSVESVRAGRAGDDRRGRRRRGARLTLRIGLLQQGDQILDDRLPLRRRARSKSGEIGLIVGNVVAPHRGPIGAFGVEAGDRRRRVRQGGDRRLNLRGVGVEWEGERRLGGVGLLPRRLRPASRLMGYDANSRMTLSTSVSGICAAVTRAVA